jgi:hypothetical protein
MPCIRAKSDRQLDKPIFKQRKAGLALFSFLHIFNPSAMQLA